MILNVDCFKVPLRCGHRRINQQPLIRRDEQGAL